MKVIIASILTMVMTGTNALAAGGADKVELSFLTILFMGFGALIITFQLIPAMILLTGMVKGLVSPAEKNSTEG